MSEQERSAEYARQLGLLNTPVGIAGSGALRYAAAMYFYKQGRISPGMLEIYRCCSKFDTEDPVDIARYEGVVIPEICETGGKR